MTLLYCTLPFIPLLSSAYYTRSLLQHADGCPAGNFSVIARYYLMLVNCVQDFILVHDSTKTIANFGFAGQNGAIQANFSGRT